jgi:hypothetical protein
MYSKSGVLVNLPQLKMFQQTEGEGENKENLRLIMLSHELLITPSNDTQGFAQDKLEVRRRHSEQFYTFLWMNCC